MRKIKLLLISITIILLVSCDKNINEPETEIISWVFVANEGEFDPNGPTNTGTISMINNLGDVYETESLGDIVHSLAIYSNKLIVSVNNSQKILIFDISEEGLSENYNEILIEDSPREIMIINDKAYFTTWNPDYNIYTTINGYIIVLNLQNLQIEESIEVGIMPEGMLLDGNYLWVANSGESTIKKIEIQSNSVTETINVGEGPQNLIAYNGDIYVSRTFYDSDWNTTHGSSKIGLEVIMKNYGTGVPCAGTILNYNNQIYRTGLIGSDGGIFPLYNHDLSFKDEDGIGNYNQSQIYHTEVIDNNIWFAITNHTDMNEIKVVDLNGLEIASYEVGTLPGDFAKWEK